MAALRETLKRTLPAPVKDALVRARDRLAPPPLEDIVLHDYELVADPSDRPRLTLVIPTVSPKKAFGGVTTGIDIFLEIGKRTGADLRILLDDFERGMDTSVVDKCARSAGFDPAAIEILPRTRDVPRIPVRAGDVFYTFNWATTLNTRRLLAAQVATFGGRPKPHLYAIQEYEPNFDPFSSTHMMARLAFEPRWPCWGLFNSGELYAYFQAQGHRVERAYVFEPQLSASLRPFLGASPPVKTRRILVYGRPTVPRNCYPAIEKGLRAWADRYPEFADWEVVSAGLPHSPTPFGRGRTMQSLGKLSLEAYGEMLRRTAVGLSLMASPHPSYPPLEMAHFGLRTVTNKYANKDLAGSHPNILSIDDIAPDSIAGALAEACRAFEADPTAGWLAPSARPSFLDPRPFDFLDDLADALSSEVWDRATPASRAIR
jgi:hypothetical protein